MALIELEKLTFCYPLRQAPALDDVSFHVEEGDFVVVCGESGCGKSTLLRHLKPVLTPHGTRTGIIRYDGAPLERIDPRRQAQEIGFVFQNPDNQLVTDKVWHELAFGLESLGRSQQEIRRRVAEMASFFGIQDWFSADVSQLSGGQKQLLNLASVMAMQPRVLVLDEPTSQLDPIAASEFLQTVKKLNRDIGTTVILTEHRLEEVFPLADRIAVMQQGRLMAYEPPAQAGAFLTQHSCGLQPALPAPLRLRVALDDIDAGQEFPLTVRDGRKWLSRLMEGRPIAYRRLPVKQPPKREELFRVKEVWFRYEKNGRDIVRDLSFTVRQGEFFCIVGGNGAGKTTTLSLLGGVLRPTRGKVLYRGKEVSKYHGELYKQNLAVLPQSPQALFVHKTVHADLMEMVRGEDDAAQRIEEIAQQVGIAELLDAHPYDLSGGEQQKAALAKVLLLRPRVLLMDEPTKGLDGDYKQMLGQLLQQLQSTGLTIVMVTHDIEFSAQFADRCAMFFDGSIVSSGEPRAFFGGNSFYTTAANRLSRHIFDDAVTCGDVESLCRRNLQGEEAI